MLELHASNLATTIEQANAIDTEVYNVEILPTLHISTNLKGGSEAVRSI